MYKIRLIISKTLDLQEQKQEEITLLNWYFKQIETLKKCRQFQRVFIYLQVYNKYLKKDVHQNKNYEIHSCLSHTPILTDVKVSSITLKCWAVVHYF